MSKETSLDDDIGLIARQKAIFLIESALLRRNGLEEAGNDPQFLALSEGERSFARALALFVLRRLGQLDHIIAKKTKKRPPEAVRALLRIGMAQVFFMQVPDFAAVSTTVKMAERDPKTRPFKGLINAILRGLIREGALAAVKPSHLVPDWLMARWRQTYGEETANEIALCLMQEPMTDLSFKSMAALEEAKEALEGEAIGGLSLRSALKGDVRHWAQFDQGRWWVQDFAAAVCVGLLGDLSGKEALDMCAAPGGKTLQLIAKGARVVALDRSKNRLKRVEENLARMGYEAELLCTQSDQFDDPREFDVVLLDAPCSATGTFRRHPDVLWASKPSDIPKLCDVQHRMLDTAAVRVRKGGELLYSVCSLEREEGETQIIAFLRRNPDFSLQKPTQTQIEALGIPAISQSDDGWLRLLPSQKPGGQDGFFIAHMKRVN